MKFKDMKIKTKMFSLLIGVSLLSMTGMNIVTTHLIEGGMIKIARPFIQLYGQMAAIAIVGGLELDDPREVETAMSNFTGGGLFSYIRVLDQANNELYYYRASRLKDIREEERKYLGGEGDEMIQVVPVESEGTKIGTISLGISFGALGQSMGMVHMVTIVLSLVMSAMFVGITFFMGRIIIKPLEKIIKISQEITEGNLTQEISIERNDEIGLLGKAFSKMMKELRLLMSRVKNSSEQIAQASESLCASSQEMSSSSDETERQVQAASQTSDHTNQNVQSVATAAEQMSATINEISKNIQDESKITKHAVRLAESTNARMSKLDQSSKEIGEVIKVITSIAQQTNLLALNATIEAARAGEAGKGFAVVANEVKELAKETSDATEEIRDKISAIQSDTQGAISAIAEISKVVGQISEISTTIAGAIEEQAVTTTEITRNISEAAEGTHQVVQNYAEITSASKTTAEGTGSIFTASQNLSRMGTELKALVEKYRY